MILEYRGVRPRIGNNVFIAPTAVVIGDVEIRDNASIWYGSVVRGDRDTITIGENTNIQDNCTLHTTFNDSVVEIGDDVTVGHNVVIHGARIGDHALIGIGSVLLDHVVVGSNTIVAAGSVVTRDVPAGTLVMGAPAQVKRELTAEARAEQRQHARRYRQLADAHAEFHAQANG